MSLQVRVDKVINRCGEPDRVVWGVNQALVYYGDVAFSVSGDQSLWVEAPSFDALLEVLR